MSMVSHSNLESPIALGSPNTPRKSLPYIKKRGPGRPKKLKPNCPVTRISSSTYHQIPKKTRKKRSFRIKSDQPLKVRTILSRVNTRSGNIEKDGDISRVSAATSNPIIATPSFSESTEARAMYSSRPLCIRPEKLIRQTVDYVDHTRDHDADDVDKQFLKDSSLKVTLEQLENALSDLKAQNPRSFLVAHRNVASLYQLFTREEAEALYNYWKKTYSKDAKTHKAYTIFRPVRPKRHLIETRLDKSRYIENRNLRFMRGLSLKRDLQSLQLGFKLLTDMMRVNSVSATKGLHALQSGFRSKEGPIIATKSKTPLAIQQTYVQPCLPEKNLVLAFHAFSSVLKMAKKSATIFHFSDHGSD